MLTHAIALLQVQEGSGIAAPQPKMFSSEYVMYRKPSFSLCCWYTEAMTAAGCAITLSPTKMKMPREDGTRMYLRISARNLATEMSAGARNLPGGREVSAGKHYNNQAKQAYFLRSISGMSLLAFEARSTITGTRSGYELRIFSLSCRRFSANSESVKKHIIPELRDHAYRTGSTV